MSTGFHRARRSGRSGGVSSTIFRTAEGSVAAGRAEEDEAVIRMAAASAAIISLLCRIGGFYRDAA